MYKLLKLDGYTLTHITMWKLFILDGNTWYNIIVCKQMIIAKKNAIKKSQGITSLAFQIVFIMASWWGVKSNI